MSPFQYHTSAMPPPAVFSSANETPVVDTEVMDIFTAPTTPDGSLTFSPVLQALKLKDALENETLGKRKTIESLDNAHSSSYSEVRNVCCIGAGYVGKCA